MLPVSPTPLTIVPCTSPTATRIPPFTPLTSRTGTRPITPETDSGSEEFALIPAQIPKGSQLVVRGCVSDDPTETPTVLVKNLLPSLGLEEQYDFFKLLTVAITPFSDRSSNLSSACYIELKHNAGEPITEPRVDLLEIIMKAISEAKPEWEVRWSASRKGRSDKRLSCRLLDLYPGITNCNDIPAADLPIIKDHIEKKGYRVAAIFAAYGGPQVSFLLPSDADRFMALGSFSVPSKVSKYSARIEPLKEIPVERPFELVVSGMRDWKHMESRIERWARKTAPGSWISSRTTELNADLFIFSMATWSDTLKILRAEDSFRKVFPEPMVPPCQLWDYNNKPTRTTLGDQVFKGADQISTVKSMALEIRELKNEIRAAQIKQDDMASAQSKLIDQVLSLHQRIYVTQQALLVQGHEEKIRSRIVELESQIGSLRVLLLFPAESERRNEIQGALEELTTELAVKRTELMQVADQFASVIGSN